MQYNEMKKLGYEVLPGILNVCHFQTQLFNKPCLTAIKTNVKKLKPKTECFMMECTVQLKGSMRIKKKPGKIIL